jgi:hypothetical protein
MNAFELLQDPIDSCRVDDFAASGQNHLRDDCECVCFLDADGHEVGVITARDIRLAAYRQCWPLWHMDVGSAIANPTASGTTRR